MKSKFFIFIAALPAIAAVIGFAAIAPSAFAATSVESVKLTAPNTITIVYSEPVYTSPSDYFDFTGSFAGNSVNSITGSGSATITLTLADAESSGATGYLTIGTNVQDVSDQQYFSGSTWNIQSSIGPAITSFGVSSNDENGSFAGTNDTLTVTFDTNEQVNALNVNIDGHSVAASGSGTGPYTASYTMQSGDNVASIPIMFMIEDNNNNQSNISFTYTGSGTTVANGETPTVAASISQVMPVPVTTTSATPSYTFYTNEPGTIVYGGGCTSPTSAAVAGSNTITFNALANGTYSSCTIAIVNSSGVESGALTISSFTVNTSASASATTGSDSSGITSEIQSLESQLTSLEAQAANGSTSSGSGETDASKGFDFTEFLGVGSQNAQVAALQERLIYDGYLATGEDTGYYGALTQAAVEKYQSANGIDVKGYVGPGTRAALNAGK